MSLSNNSSNSLTAGTVEVKGDFAETCSYSGSYGNHYWETGTHKTIFSGGSVQNVRFATPGYNRFENPIFRNPHINFTTGIYSLRLVENTVIDSTEVLKPTTLDLNGFSLTTSGDVEANTIFGVGLINCNNITVSDSFTVNGNSVINGNLTVQKLIFRNNNLTVKGNCTINNYLEMTHDGDYLLVKEGNARVVSNALRPYYLGEKEYVLNYEPGYDPCLLMRERGGEWQDTGLDCGNKCTLISTQYGLVVHCSGYSKGGKQHLYLIQPTGEAVELLSFPCLYSVSAINIFEDKLYYSIQRYEKYGEIGMTRYEDDEVEGTYIINLTDLSAEKISDMIFDGLYIFDNSGIYACDEHCSVYKLDFDGNVIDTLIEVSK
jgi:hypothetical protein